MSKGIQFLFKKNSIVHIKGNGKLAGKNSVEVEEQDGAKKTYTATNNPQPMTTPKATTIPSNENYYPQSYPNGTWDVKDVIHPNNNAYGQTKISTNAGQNVPTYTQVNGSWEQTGTTWDEGYQIHGGGYSGSPQGQNNVNDNTYGCIRMNNADVNELGKFVHTQIKTGATVTLTVQTDKPKGELKNK